MGAPLEKGPGAAAGALLFIRARSCASQPAGAGVAADGGGSVYYQQQVLGTVPRSTVGAGY